MIDLSQMRVLICDDMENMAKSIRGMLKVLGYGSQFSFATNGREGWNVLKSKLIDMAIIDWNMPVMTGIELLELIREDKELRHLPVLMVTAEANKEIVAEAAESDIDAYLLKPLTVKSLGDKIEAVIEKANNPSELVLLLRKAQELAEAGHYDEALAEGFKAIKKDPNSSKPIRMVAYFYFLKKDYETSKRFFLKAAQMNKLDVFAFHHLGEIFLVEKDFDNAGKFYDKAMSISPRHLSRAMNFGKVLLTNQKFTKAVKVFESIIQRSGGSLSLKEEISNLVFEAGLYKYALRLFGQILDKYPDKQDLVYKIGISHHKLGDDKHALPFFLQYEKMDKTNIDVKLLIVRCYMTLGRVYAADEILTKILRMDPENEEALELRSQNI